MPKHAFLEADMWEKKVKYFPKKKNVWILLAADSMVVVACVA